MNLPLALKIIKEAEAHGGHHYHVHTGVEAREVQQMAEVGLVKASEIDDPINPHEATIDRVTHAGRQFVRALRDAPRYALA
jgi:hypothetical protein